MSAPRSGVGRMLGTSTDVVGQVAGNRTRWARMAPRDKIGYLDEVRRRVVQYSSAWVDVGARFKGFAPDSALAVVEEWLQGPILVAGYLHDLIESLEAIAAGRSPLQGLPIRVRQDGRVLVRVLPTTLYERLQQMAVDVWVQPRVGREEVEQSAGWFYRQAEPTGRVTALLGAGNAAMLTPLDVLSLLVVDGDVVVAKMNPVNEVYGPVIEQVLEPLISDGFVRFVYGGAEVGSSLVADPRVERVHMTGGASTYDAIVWGPGEEGAARKRAGTPLLDKPFTAELGGVGPTVVVPGHWSPADVALHAEIVATEKLNVSGHICAASQVLVLPAHWDQCDEFVDAVRSAMIEAPHREAFYPGTEAMITEVVATNPTAQTLPCRQPRVLLTDLDHTDDHDTFRRELFGPVLSTTALPGETPEEYVAHAVSFCNERLSGNLGVSVDIDPATARDLGPAWDRALTSLRYGAVGINTWSVFAAAVGRAAWGAFPGNTPEDIQSGVGFVHNAAMIASPEKTVVSSAFRPTPPLTRRGEYLPGLTPFWLVSKTDLSVDLARALLRLYAEPDPRALVSVLRAMAGTLIPSSTSR